MAANYRASNKQTQCKACFSFCVSLQISGIIILAYHRYYVYNWIAACTCLLQAKYCKYH